MTVEVVEPWNTASTVTTRTSLQWTRRAVVLGHVMMIGRTGHELFHQHAVHRELLTTHRRRNALKKLIGLKIGASEFRGPKMKFGYSCMLVKFI